MKSNEILKQYEGVKSIKVRG